MHDDFHNSSLEYLQDKTIGVVGMHQFRRHLQAILGANTTNLSREALLMLLCMYVRIRAAHHFKVEIEELEPGLSKIARNGKMCCFYLLKKHTKSNSSEIEIELFGELEKVPGRSARYYANLCEKKLAKSQSDSRFKRQFDALTSDFLNFLGHFVTD